jgi:hypothetical protein
MSCCLSIFRSRLSVNIELLTDMRRADARKSLEHAASVARHNPNFIVVVIDRFLSSLLRYTPTIEYRCCSCAVKEKMNVMCVFSLVDGSNNNPHGGDASKFPLSPISVLAKIWLLAKHQPSRLSALAWKYCLK